jgi:hypothetical protein
VDEDASLSRGATAVIDVIGGGVAGACLGLGLGLWRQAGLQLQGGPDPIRFFVDNTPTLAWAAVGGGCGWLVGAFLGWSRGQDARPSVWGAWIERLLAAGFVVAGVLTLRLIPSAAIARGSDTNLGYDVNILRWAVLVDVAIAVATLLVVSLRVRLPRSVFAVVSICAVVAVGAAGIRVGSLPPPGRQWLRYWLSTRQAPLGAAANLIAEAPRACGSLVPDPYPEEIDSFAIGVPSVYYWINPFAPRWLPDDMGLALDHSWPDPRPHALWTDTRCDEVSLVIYQRPSIVRTLEAHRSDPTHWWLARTSWCSDPSKGCLEYRVEASIAGSHAKQLLVLRSAGLPPDEVARIALSIPTDHVPYI